MRARPVLLAVLVIAVAGSVVLPAEGATPDGEPAVSLEVTVEESGDALWVVTARYTLTDQNETAAFDEFRADFEANETDGGPQIETFRALANRGAAETDRPMSIVDIERTSTILNRSAVQSDGTATGVLRLEFRWIDFATTDEGTVSIGDAFGGSWTLGADQELIIRPPSGYSVDTVRPSTAVDSGVLRWTGPLTFDADEPAVTYVSANPGTTEDTTTTSDPGPGNGDQNVFLGYVAGITIALIGGGLAVYAWLQRDEFFDEGSKDSAMDSTSAGDSSSESPDFLEEGDDGTAESIPPDQSDDVQSDGASDIEGDSEESPAGEGIDPALLSDEERVERLLEDNGGRMKQADIVEETGWSNAKVSQLLSGMAEEGRVDKLRIGRENLIRLPDED